MAAGGRFNCTFRPSKQVCTALHISFILDIYLFNIFMIIRGRILQNAFSRGLSCTCRGACCRT